MGSGGGTKQRHRSRDTRCPVCGGWETLPRGCGERCGGYTQGDYAYCTQIPAGDHQQNAGGAYPHFLAGPCDCGQSHDGTPLARILAATKAKTPAKLLPRLPEVHPRTHQKCTGRYEYLDSLDEPYYVVLRFGAGDKKTFLQFRPVGLDKWAPDLDGVQRVLYRLPELLAADPEAPVFIVEGEKDADRLAALGLIATTNAGGAGSWHTVADAPEQLRGRRVIILEDNDQAGRDRTYRIAKSLEGSAASVRVVRFPTMAEHSDVSDWLDAGGEASELERMAETIGGSNQDEKTPPEVAEVQAENARLREACARMNEKLAWIFQVLEVPGDRMSPAEKVAAIQVQRLSNWQDSPKRDEQGYTPVYLAQLSEKTGTSPATVSKSLACLESMGVMKVRRLNVTTPTGRETRLSIAPVSSIERPRLWMPPEGPRQHGGKRAGSGRKPRVCSECGSEHLEERTIIQTIKRTTVETHCMDCGTILPPSKQEVVLTEEVIKGSIQDENTPEDTRAVEGSIQDDFPPSLTLIGEQDENTPLVEPVQAVNPDDPENTYQKRVRRLQDKGVPYLEACNTVAAQNRAWWAQQNQQNQEAG